MKLLVLISLILPHRRGEGGGQLGLEEAHVGGVLGAVGIFSRRTKALRGGAHPGALCGTPTGQTNLQEGKGRAMIITLVKYWTSL